MLNPTAYELIFIRACVILLNYTPVFYVFLPPTIFVVALLVELTYYLFVLRPFESRLKSSAIHPLNTRQEREALFQRCVQNVPDIERYLSLWALGADIKDIKRDNVRDFFLWAFFDCEDTGGHDMNDELEGYIVKTEEMLNRPLPPGRGDVKPMRLTIDKIQTRYRSVIWYFVVGLVDSVTHGRMLWSGFKFYTASIYNNLLHVFPPRLLACLERSKRHSPSDQLSYWYRPAVNESTLPIVFLHGIGIGLYPYIPFLSSLPPTSPLLAVEILPICMRLTKTNILTVPEFLSHFKEILRHHGIDKFVLVGHSYGSVLITNILHDYELQPRVEGVVLVDPVTLLLHLPDVAYNFTRRMPRTANEWQLWYLASMDPGIALVLGRHFFWRENIIWKDELVDKGGSKRKAAVCLSSRDLIVDTLSVARYLVSDKGLAELGRSQPMDDEELAVGLNTGFMKTNCGVEMLWFKGKDHAQVFDRQEDYKRIVEVIRQFCIYP